MISKRLKTIASLIDNNSSLLDIGCDHGYLAAQLRSNGNNQLIICSDNKQGPLSSAKNNLQYYNNIDYVLSDGAKEIKKLVDVVTICGMGYHTVISIISNSLKYFNSVKRIIIQVNSDVDKMRQWLVDNNFKIVDEHIVLDIKYYQILVVENGQQQLTDLQIKYGPYLLEKKDSTFIKYLNMLLDKNKKIIEGIDKTNNDYQLIKNKIEEIENILRSF